MTIRTALALVAMLGASPAMAQDNGEVGAQAVGDIVGEPAAQANAAIDPATLTMPNLAFTETPAISGDYDKYYFFHRADTGFAEAHADVLECDAFASGLRTTRGGNGIPTYAYAYGIGGVIGGIAGSVLADAIHGSAARRKMRRINMRNCMGFKGYTRHGLSKDLWEAFNFEEGNGRENEESRRLALATQALVASAGPKPATEALGI